MALPALIAGAAALFTIGKGVYDSYKQNENAAKMQKIQMAKNYGSVPSPTPPVEPPAPISQPVTPQPVQTPIPAMAGPAPMPAPAPSPPMAGPSPAPSPPMAAPAPAPFSPVGLGQPMMQQKNPWDQYL